MVKKLSRRDFLHLSAAAGAGAMLGLHASPSAIPAMAQSQVDLRFVWWGGQTRADVTTQVIKMFEAKNPNIKFTYEFLSFNDYWTKVTTQAAGGGLPDVMQTGSQQLVEWSKKGLHVPLEEYVKSSVIDFTNIPKTLQDQGAVDGKLYGISAGSNAIGFALDLDAFKKAGVEVPPDTWTWEDFEKTVMALHDKLKIWGFGHYLHHFDLWGTLYAGLDTRLYAADGKSLGYTDDQPLIDHMKMIMRLQEAKAIPSLAEEAEIATKGPESYFSVTGKSAIDWLAGSNQLVALWTAAGKDRNYKILPIPRIKGKKQGTTIRPSQFLAVTKSSKNPKEAAMFINFFTNDVEANKVLNAERGVPINSTVLKALTDGAAAPQKAVYDYLDRLSKDSALYSTIPDPVGVEAIRTNAYYPLFTDPVRYKKISPEEGVATLRKKANETLAAAK